MQHRACLFKLENTKQETILQVSTITVFLTTGEMLFDFNKLVLTYVLLGTSLRACTLIFLNIFFASR
jgi:hypothetical protein